MKLRTVVGIFCSLIVFLVLMGCTSENAATPPAVSTGVQSAEATATIAEDDVTKELFADVISVKVTGEEEAYQFSVGISSPDESCDQYADWWEVIGQDGDLLYRRILLHSHVGEQPFVRSGGQVGIPSDKVVWVRAHMHPTGYGGMAMKGSVAQGFEQIELSADFASELTNKPPLPEGCDF